MDVKLMVHVCNQAIEIFKNSQICRLRKSVIDNHVHFHPGKPEITMSEVIKFRSYLIDQLYETPKP